MLQAEIISRSESIAQFLTVFLVFLLVLALTYFTTRFVGSFQKASSFNKNFEAIETYRITNGKYLQLVRVGQKYIVIGIGKDDISMLCEISEDELDLTKEKPQASEAFSVLMEKARERIKKGGDQNEK